jgi:hypothetical protein
MTRIVVSGTGAFRLYLDVKLIRDTKCAIETLSTAKRAVSLRFRKTNDAASGVPPSGGQPCAIDKPPEGQWR